MGGWRSAGRTARLDRSVYRFGDAWRSAACVIPEAPSAPPAASLRASSRGRLSGAFHPLGRRALLARRRCRPRLTPGRAERATGGAPMGGLTTPALSSRSHPTPPLISGRYQEPSPRGGIRRRLGAVRGAGIRIADLLTSILKTSRIALRQSRSQVQSGFICRLAVSAAPSSKRDGEQGHR